MNNNYNEWQHQATALANTGVMSWRDIAQYVGVPKSTVSDFLRAYFKIIHADVKNSESHATFLAEDNPIKLYGGAAGNGMSFVFEDKHDNSRVLFISDMHIPYHHENTIPFLKMLKERYSPTRVICVGDELDYHNISFHDSDQDLFSAGHELKEAIKVVQELYEIFPQMDLIDSNHGSLVYRKAKHHGIPRHCIKSYNEILEVGDGWKWHPDLTIELPTGESVYIHHGKSANGLQLSQSMGMSSVQGHFHEKFNVSYWANSLGLYFSMQIGCLISDENYAFAYNNVNLKRPIVGTGLLIDGIPVLEAMSL